MLGLWDYDRIDEDEPGLREWVREQDGLKHLVVAVHGFNQTKDDAHELGHRIRLGISRPALGDRCETVMLRWPSAGLVSAYLRDRRTCRRVAPVIAGYVADRLPPTPDCEIEISLICHSMGAYLGALVLQSLEDELGGPVFPLSEVLLVAPDLDDDDLQPGRLGHAYVRVARRVTVYSSLADGALRASAAKRMGSTGPRLGRTGPADLAPSIAWVDTTPVNDGLGSHGEYFELDPVLADMRQVLAGVDRGLIDGRIRNERRGAYVLQTTTEAA